MSKTPLDTKMEELADGFANGDSAAFGEVYKVAHPLLVARAIKSGMEPCDAEDCASDAILYVSDRGERPRSLLATLLWAGDIMVKRHQRDAGRVVTYGGTDEGDDDFVFTDDLEGVEEYKLAQGGELHEYLTSIETTTPEDETLAENLREFVERKAIEACGQESWDIYYNVVVLDETQGEVAEKHGMDQSTVSRRVREVGLAIREALVQGS